MLLDFLYQLRDCKVPVGLQEWMALMIEALRLTALGEYQQSQEIRDQAFETAPTTSGRIDGKSFNWIADADPRMGPILEVIVNGRYYWIPIYHIETIKIEEPADLRDLVWIPAHFTWVNEGETVGFIPTRYAGSEQSDDPLVRLSRKTEWIEKEGGLFLGMGQRTLSTDADEYPLMDIREITLESTEQGSGQDTAAGVE